MFLAMSFSFYSRDESLILLNKKLTEAGWQRNNVGRVMVRDKLNLACLISILTSDIVSLSMPLASHRYISFMPGPGC